LLGVKEKSMRILLNASISSFLITTFFMVIFVCFFGSYRYVKADLPPEVLSAMTDSQRSQWNASNKESQITGVEFIKMASTDNQMQLALAKAGFILWLSGFLSTVLAILWLRRRVNA
jgi:hypothetical protein